MHVSAQAERGRFISLSGEDYFSYFIAAVFGSNQGNVAKFHQ